MNFNIVSLGNVEFLTQILNGVAMICGTGDWTRLVAVGFVIGLLFIGFQCIFEGGQRINLHHTVVCFLCYLCFFGPNCTVVIEDAYTGEARTVDNLPLGVGVSGMAISGIGYGVTKLIEQGFSPYDRTSEHEFGEPLRILNRLRSAFETDDIWNAINGELGARANGAPSDAKQAVTNYLSECTMVKVQLGATTVAKLYRSNWGDGEFKLESQAHTTYLPIAGVATAAGDSETVSCNAGYDKLAPIWAKLDTAPVKKTINRLLHIDNGTGTDTADDYAKISSSMESLNATMTGAQDMMRMLIVDGVYDSAASKFYTTQHDQASAIAVNQAIWQRNTQWASEGTMFLNVSRGLMAFFEGFIYAITPIMGFLIAIGSFGVSLVAKYFMTIVWIQLWLPILSILNLYIMTGARFAITRAALDVPSFYALDTLWAETQTWVATGGMLTAATPMIALFLVSGSTYAFTTLTNRMGGQDHFNERIGTPDVASPSAVLGHQSHYTANRIDGLTMTGSPQAMPSLTMGNTLARVQASRQALMNTATDTLNANVTEAAGDAVAQQAMSAYQQRIGSSVQSAIAFGNQTMHQLAMQNTAYASATEAEQKEAMATLAASIGVNGEVRAGVELGKDKKGNIQGGLAGQLAAHFGLNGGMGISGSIGGEGKSASTDKATSGLSNTKQFGGGFTAQQTKSVAASLTQARDAAVANIDSSTWTQLANQTKGTSIGKAFGDVASASRLVDQAKMLNKNFGANQKLNAAQLVTSLENSSQIDQILRAYKGSLGAAGSDFFKADAKKWERLLGGETRGEIAAMIHGMESNLGNIGMQERLANVLGQSNLPVMGFTPTTPDSGEGLRKPVDTQTAVNAGERQIRTQKKALDEAKPAKVDAKTEMDTNLPGNYNDNSAAVENQAGKDRGQVMNEAQEVAVRDLEQLPRNGFGVWLASNFMQNGPFDALTNMLSNMGPASPDGGGRRIFGNA